MDRTDRQILEGFSTFDPDVTKEFFYGYCRRAYRIFDCKYRLHTKTGLDFWSLAHEYYIHLMTNQFRPLYDKPDHMKLSTWMTRGFHFVVLDALKAYNKEFGALSEATSDAVLEYVRSTDVEEGMLFQVAEAVASHYHDRMMQEMAHMIFYAGFKQKEVAEKLHITPSAVNQRYKKMMEEVVTPFVIENYGTGLVLGSPCLSMLADEDFPCNAGAGFGQPSFSKLRKAETMDGRITPDHITSLNPGEIFVFGSNLMGMHGGGAARTARLQFGAVMGQGTGLQGRSYAIPTMQGGVETIKPYVDEFIAYAAAHPENHFLVTPIGCGIAGFEPADIAPLFEAAKDMKNVSLPRSFRNILQA